MGDFIFWPQKQNCTWKNETVDEKEIEKKVELLFEFSFSPLESSTCNSVWSLGMDCPVGSLFTDNVYTFYFFLKFFLSIF